MVKVVQELRKHSVISCEVHICTNVPLVTASGPEARVFVVLSVS